MIRITADSCLNETFILWMNDIRKGNNRTPASVCHCLMMKLNHAFNKRYAIFFLVSRCTAAQ